MAGIDDLATNSQETNKILRQLVSVLIGLFPRTTGTFTMAAAATKTVTDANVTTSSFIVLMPTNAAAGTLVGSAKSPYITTASGSFVVSTANGVAAAGTEVFDYAVFNAL